MLQTPTQELTGGGERLTVGVAARLSRYLQVLTQAKKMGKDRISSQEISDYTYINATQIRRDLSAFGKFGKRGVGYNIDSLLGEIRKILRTQGQHNIVLVGAGRLGEAIASSPIFAEHGINVAAVVDTDPDKVGRPVGHVEVSPYGELREIIRDKNEQFFFRFRPVNAEYVVGRRVEPFGSVNFPPEMKQLDQMVADRDKAIWKRAAALKGVRYSEARTTQSAANAADRK
ncbi:MAG TPA: redox-sensing transcriptional repressor Rex [Thermoanaerobaculia bacterium]|nr:redox-sensing transcriptional repressor Rex [Thermoanaerobaculia bacterium]